MAKSEFEIGRKPDYVLSVLNKGNEHKGRVGVAWINEDGSLSIKLNAFVVLSAVQDLLITLFPNDGKFENGRGKKSAPEDDGGAA